MRHFTIAGLQINHQDRQNFDLFRNKARATIRRFPFTQMIIGSELSICGAGVNYAAPMLNEIEGDLCDLAVELGIWLVPGSIYQRQGDLIFNTAPYIRYIKKADVRSRFDTFLIG